MPSPSGGGAMHVSSPGQPVSRPSQVPRGSGNSPGASSGIISVSGPIGPMPGCMSTGVGVTAPGGLPACPGAGVLPAGAPAGPPAGAAAGVVFPGPAGAAIAPAPAAGAPLAACCWPAVCVVAVCMLCPMGAGCEIAGCAGSLPASCEHPKHVSASRHDAAANFSQVPIAASVTICARSLPLFPVLVILSTVPTAQSRLTSIA